MRLYIVIPILLTAALIANCNTTGKIFTSPDRKFSLRLPLYWEEYEDGEEDTFAFFNSKSWTGNLRITPLYWSGPNDGGQNKAAAFIQNQLKENEGAVELKLGNFDCIHYKNEIEQDDDKLVMYYWAVGKRANLFMCSLTISKEQEKKEINKKVLETVQDIIRSIKIN